MRKAVNIFVLLFFVFFAPLHTDAQQEDMFKQKKERKRVWRRWRSNREAYNPYLKKKNKNKESVRTSQGVKQETKRQRRIYQRELKRTRRKKGIKTP